MAHLSTSGELQRCFRQQNFIFEETVEKLLLDSANGKPVTLTKKISRYVQRRYRYVITETSPSNASYVIKCTLLDGITIKNVTRVHSICHVLNENLTFKTLLSEVHKLLKLYYAIPVTTASAERNLSEKN